MFVRNVVRHGKSRFENLNTNTREERALRVYQTAVRKALIDLLLLINPQDQLSYGGLKYEELVAYAKDWLETEAQQSAGQDVAEPESLAPSRAGSPLPL